MRRVDRRTNALPDRPTNQPTDTARYRGALSHLKTKTQSEEDREKESIYEGEKERKKEMKKKEKKNRNRETKKQSNKISVLRSGRDDLRHERVDSGLRGLILG